MSSDRRYALIGHTHAASSVAWGSITGTLSAQTDLQSALDAKSDTSHVHEGTTIDATGVTDGWVLTADGAGNAAWEASVSGVTDHGALTGLSDDDHPLYAQNAATEDITGAWRFYNSGGVYNLTVDGTQANINFRDNNATADEGNWILRCSAGNIQFSTATDLAPTAAVDTPFQITRTGTTMNFVRSNADFQVRGGKYLRVYDSGNTDYCNMSHDGTDMIYGHTNTGQAKFNGISVLKSAGTLMISESAADQTSEASFGQFWVKNDVPNNPWWTDDGDNSYPLGFAAYRTFANQTDTVDQFYVNGAWYSDDATAYTLTLEASSSTAFPVGAQFTIWNEGSGTLTINEGTGDTLWLLDGSAVTDTAGGCTMAQGGYATVIRKSAATWLIMGAGLTA